MLVHGDSVAEVVGLGQSKCLVTKGRGQRPRLQRKREATSLTPCAVVHGLGNLAGLCFGAAQWFVLRRYSAHAARWIWIHLPAWALAMSAIVLGASVPDADWPPWAIMLAGLTGGILGGVLLGAVTGLVARALRPKDDVEAQPPIAVSAA